MKTATSFAAAAAAVLIAGGVGVFDAGPAPEPAGWSAPAESAQNGPPRRRGAAGRAAEAAAFAASPAPRRVERLTRRGTRERPVSPEMTAAPAPERVETLTSRGVRMRPGARPVVEMLAAR